MTTLIFDCDGVLADTERHGHLPAFNQAFEEEGVPVRWSDEEYAERVKIGGGKERMASLLTESFVREHGLPADADGQKALLARWHKRKTAAYKGLVASGAMPGRPGIARLIDAALREGWTVAVASTSAEESVRAVLEHAVGPAQATRIQVFAGDVVPAKKPDPGIYRLALERTGADPADTLAVEDSRNGMLAAVGAGLRTLVTVSSYTKDEDFSEAVLVVSSLGDPGEPTEVLANRSPARPGDHITLDDLRACLRAPAPTPQEVS
jgi:HAD superfamily hydrolase (TIGR01509 family)